MVGTIKKIFKAAVAQIWNYSNLPRLRMSRLRGMLLGYVEAFLDLGASRSQDLPIILWWEAHVP